MHYSFYDYEHRITSYHLDKLHSYQYTYDKFANLHSYFAQIHTNFL
ncbi:hypothetical protein DY048_04775 [Apilactobacillus timberlakei]|uniref:Uncharacterized protein n=1 Tax=Apilactobacillus timberlakei TaxID=2008380 RepID=A0ABY2YT72_9LACO|nr:hypothetical protein DY048_04775 [Apilactobacillus timberlakei]TPR16517.1 hypothetical protein DY052_02865 [Apilactobacillus timberlakei]TPR19205.1 hypothetical protein DYZ95_00895 [Apilactobacillus timberlakei]